MAEPAAGGVPAPPAQVELVLLPAHQGTAINASPFSTKLLAFVRMAGIEHTVGKSSFGGNKNPRGKWPYIVHGGKVVPDSSACARHLAAAFPDAAGRLFPSDPVAAGRMHAVDRMLSEGLLPPLLYYRFIEPANAAHMEASYFGFMPWPLRKLVARSVVARVRNRLDAQGILKLSEPELLEVVRADLASLAAQLGPGPFLLGPAPCHADAALFGFLDTMLHDGAPNVCVRDMVLHDFPSLAAFSANIRARYFPELGPGAFGGRAAAAGAAGEKQPAAAAADVAAAAS